MLKKIQSWSVHLFTALGALAGFLSLEAVFANNILMSFLWLAVAFLIDGIDGAFARKVNVKENLPQIDGSTLDNVVDYLNYVFIPASIIYWFDLVAPEFKLFTVTLILVASCYTFSNVNLKTKDNFFNGFPALWNLVVFYLYILESSKQVNLLLIVFFLVMTFVPVKYVHPLRVNKWRKLTILMTFIWSVDCVFLLIELADPKNQFVSYKVLYFWTWIFTTVYFIYLSVIRSITSKY
tara:strand:- start:1039 stop:1749 length:711 start_codon:yes stop_codon:yes gene_type:complete